MYRTHNCGALRREHIGKKIILSGWVHAKRDLGAVIFIDLRDRYGITQLFFDKKKSIKIDKIGREFILQVFGIVAERSSKNRKNPTGDIEVVVSKLDILNPSLVPPFTISDPSDGNEELRMKYRYLDIRRNSITDNLRLRHKITLETRNYLSKIDFIEVETPMLIKSTLEGARDFIVPSRIHPGQFYALPQSPQLFKQLLMIGGIDKYFQIVKCFRDEDFRADRQPEFTQIDCEMSFVEQEDIVQIFEGLIVYLFREICGLDLSVPFPRISYDDAIQKYGSDKPDIRFKMTFRSLKKFPIKNTCLDDDNKKSIIGFAVPECAGYNRTELDELNSWIKKLQGNSTQDLIWVQCIQNGHFRSSVDQLLEEKYLKEWAHQLNAQPGDLLLILSGKTKEIQTQLGALRLEMGRRLGLLESKDFTPLWVVDFPLFEKLPNHTHYHAVHHPFTAPQEKDILLLNKHPEKVRAQSYDLVMNGIEIGGGSIRIHQRALQENIFSLLGVSKEKADEQFGCLMHALQYGAPPHGGIAFGLDRLAAVLKGEENIRDFIAFPKNNSGKDLMISSPSKLDKSQLQELGLQITTTCLDKI